MNPYLPVLIVLVLGMALAGLLSLLSNQLGPKKPSKVKNEPFECGMPRVGSRDRMSVKFYLTAILFILFDIESIFLFLWARSLSDLGWFGIAEVAVFVLILGAGYIYALRSGALDWET